MQSYSEKQGDHFIQILVRSRITDFNKSITHIFTLSQHSKFTWNFRNFRGWTVEVPIEIQIKNPLHGYEYVIYMVKRFLM